LFFFSSESSQNTREKNQKPKNTFRIMARKCEEKERREKKKREALGLFVFLDHQHPKKGAFPWLSHLADCLDRHFNVGFLREIWPISVVSGQGLFFLKR
jgi:hypothetical protein